jgi:hypothetical protein
MTIRLREGYFKLPSDAIQSHCNFAQNLANIALDAAASTKATVAEDMVFALNALLSRFARSTTIPNYTLTPEFVFTVATIIMLWERGLSIYCYCAVAVNLRLPSWVPDFTSQSSSSPHFTAYDRGRALSSVFWKTAARHSVYCGSHG